MQLDSITETKQKHNKPPSNHDASFLARSSHTGHLNGHSNPQKKSRNQNERRLAAIALSHPQTFQQVAGEHIAMDAQLLPGDCSNPAYEWVLLAIKNAGESYLHQLTAWADDTDELAPAERRVWSQQAIQVLDELCAESPDLKPLAAKTELCGLVSQVKARAAERRRKATRAKTEAAAANPEEFVFEFTTDEKLDECFTGIEWLWDGYIPRGFLTTVVGEQGDGKSTVVQGICDIILRGTCWPDGQPNKPQPDAKLLWIDTEGTLALFHDRLKAWGMPRGRFIFPPDPLQELTIDDARTWQWIETATERFKPPIIVVDALSGAHSAKSNDEDGMKPIMKRLAKLAQRHNIALVVIHHLSKPAPGMKAYPITIHRLRGSGAISQLSRSIIALGAPDESQTNSKRLDVIKLNLAKTPPAVGYELTDFGPAWGEAPEPPKERRAVDNALDFLTVALANGPRESKELEEEAKQAGIGRNALFDAKKVLKVVARREGGKDGRWFWYPDESSTVADGIEEGVV